MMIANHKPQILFQKTFIAAKARRITTYCTTMSTTPIWKVDPKGVESKVPLQGFDWALSWAVDFALILLFTLPAFHGEGDHQYLTFHYYSWIMISDILALMVSPARRHLFSIFRLMSGITFWYMDTIIWIKLGNQDSIFWPIARAVTCAARVFHSIHMLRKYRTDFSHFWSFPSFASNVLDQEKHAITRVSFYTWIVFSSGDCLLTHLLYTLHYNYGQVALDAIITGFQGSMILTFWLKRFVLMSLIEDPLKRMIGAWWVFFAFALQYIFMSPMITLAPVPYIHLFSELDCFMTAMFLTREWQASLPVTDNDESKVTEMEKINLQSIPPPRSVIHVD
mmetsp:Transcript_14684/g.21715  ORF Transcript_14684/g.21715 Transcript_14684/m.21715 type:complete len:337 (+) Transcript_14684:203-1213(+)